MSNLDKYLRDTLSKYNMGDDIAQSGGKRKTRNKSKSNGKTKVRNMKRTIDDAINMENPQSQPNGGFPPIFVCSEAQQQNSDITTREYVRPKETKQLISLSSIIGKPRHVTESHTDTTKPWHYR